MAGLPLPAVIAHRPGTVPVGHASVPVFQLVLYAQSLPVKCPPLVTDYVRTEYPTPPALAP